MLVTRVQLFVISWTSLLGSSVHGISQARILVGVALEKYFLLQGIFPTQGLNLGLLHWQMDSLPLETPGKPKWNSTGSYTSFLEQGYNTACLGF